MSMKIRLLNKRGGNTAPNKQTPSLRQQHRMWIASGLVLALSGCFDSDDDNDYQAPEENVAPVAVDQMLTTQADIAFDGTLTASDEDGDALTFGLGSGIAGIAGVALSQLTNVGPNMGQAYIIDSFMVVVFGGVGNLWGTLVGAMSLGVVNKILEPWAGAVVAKILVLVFIILFIQKRPRGLFALKGRSVDMG